MGLETVINGGFRDVLTNPNYRGQKILIVVIDGYAHAVPFKETKDLFFLFTGYQLRVRLEHNKPVNIKIMNGEAEQASTHLGGFPFCEPSSYQPQMN